MWETVGFLAEANGYTKRKMVLALLKYALEHAISEAIVKSNNQVEQRRQQGRQARRTRIVLDMIKAAKAKGFDIDKFF